MAAQTRPKWEQDQINSFVAWANFRWGESLKARGRPVTPLITDIAEDFKDGTRAGMLLMVLFGRSISGIKKSGKHIDNIQNWAILLNEMKREGIDFRKGSSDLVNGDIGSTLAFQWAMIRHNGSKLAQDGLLSGAKKAGKGTGASASTMGIDGAQGAASGVAGAGASGSSDSQAAVGNKQQFSMKEQMMRYINTYLPAELQVTNFTTCFQSGKVFQHLLQNLAQLNIVDSPDAKILLSNCFGAADRDLGIPAMLSADDVSAGHVAEEPVMTYVISILQGIRNRSDEGKKAAQESNAHLAALEGDGRISPSNVNVNIDASNLPPPPPPVDLPPPILPPSSLPPPVLPPNAGANAGTSGTASFGDVASAQAYSTSANASYGSAGGNPLMSGSTVGGGPGGVGAGNQNYYGSIVQGSVMMQLPEIFKIVAFGDFNNFVAYADSHPNEIFVTAEPYRINLLFTAARLTPHITAIKFMEYILARFPQAHLTQDSKLNYPMHEALEYGCLENFDFLWNLPGAPRPPLASLIHTSVWPSTTECLFRVLQIVEQAHGGNIPPLDHFLLDNRTPLITALSTPQTSVDIVRALLSRGSNPGFSSVDGQSPALVVSAACDKWEAVACMARESLYQPLPLTRMLTALLFIVGVTPNTIGQFVRLTGAPTNEDDPLTGRTPLEHAISLARSDLVIALLQHGAQVNRVSPIQPWRTPIHYALLYYAQDAYKYTETVRTLQAWGADFNGLDANGLPASHYARSLGLPPNPVGGLFASRAVM